MNKEKIEKLLSANLLSPAGLAAIELAKQSATCMALDEVTAILIPNDLQQLLDKNKIAATNYNAFPRSAKRGILEWIQNAKRPETLLKRVQETVDKASVNVKANFPG